MKRIFPVPVLLLLLMTLSILSSCTPSSSPSSTASSITLSSFDPFDPPDFTPPKAPADWITPGDYKVSHINVEAVAPQKVPARSIALPMSQQSSLLMPTLDGGCLAVAQIPVDEKDTSGNTFYYLQAIWFKADGTVKWDQQYKADTFKGYPVTMCVFPDGGFAVSLSIRKENTIDYETTDRLCRFSPDGTMVWQSKEDQVATGALDHIFATQDGAVLAAGTVAAASPAGSGSSGNNEIGLLRFEKDGSISANLTFGIVGYNTLTDASYATGTGLVLVWRSDAATAASETAASGQVSQIGCFGEDLSKQWVASMPAGESLFNVQALSGGKGAFAFGNLPSSISATSASSSQSTRSTLFHFDSKGIENWTYSMEEANTWMLKAASLSDGRFIGCGYRTATDGSQVSTLVILSKNGKFLNTLKPLPGIIEQLIPTKDGGFTVVLRQSVSAIPQPPYISSIWMDTEVIVAHYDRNTGVVWQRKIDQYKHALRIDQVIVTVDGRLLIG